MARAQANRFIRRTIYRLKRQYGVPVKVVRRARIAATNFATGKPTYLEDVYSIHRAIVLPTRETRDEEYRLFDTKWSRGAYFDTSVRAFYVDQRDAEFPFKKDDYIIYDNKHYDVVEVNDYEEARGFIVVAKEVKGGPLYQVHEVEVIVGLNFANTSGGTL